MSGFYVTRSAKLLKLAREIEPVILFARSR
jgi:hypothetical protein